MSTTTYVTSTSCSTTQYLQPSDVDVGQCVDASQSTERIWLPPTASNPTGKWIGGLGWTTANQELKLCPLGFYCPLNEQDGVYNLQIPCKEGDWCPPGLVQPLQCPSMRKCGANGDELKAAGAGIAVASIFIVVIAGLFCFARWRKIRRLHNSERAQFLYADADASEFGKAAVGDDKIAPVLIEFDKVGLRLKTKAKPRILSDVTGFFPPCSLVALMGPSGCGKTSFMSAICGRAQYGEMEGEVRINGVKDGLSTSPSLVGFVPQDDILHAELTVYDNIHYQVQLRCGSQMSAQDKKRHVEQVIQRLGLDKVRDQLVGDEERRGISGGQRKRVNIALELGAMPAIIFMDEPTSGLDGAATATLADCLAQLVKLGLTIIVVIHQPRARVYEQFDHLLLLGEGGKQVYCGRREYVVNYLNGVGFQMPASENPADWIIDVCSGIIVNSKDQGFNCPDDLYAHWAAEGAANALSLDSQWVRGDTYSKEEVAKKLVPPKHINICASIFHLTDRAFRQIDIDAWMKTLFIFALLGLVVGTAVDPPYLWGNITHILDGGVDIFSMIACVIHRSDYGDQKVNLLRELNVGVPAVGLFIANSLRIIGTTFFESMAYAVPKYIMMPPYQGFGIYLCAHWGVALWWAQFAAWISLCTGKTTSTMLCLFAPNIVKMFDGTVGGDGLGNDVELLEDTVRESKGSYIFPNRWFWQLTYAKEIEDYPDYIRNNTIVNSTMYWRDIPDDLSYAQSEAATHLFVWPIFLLPWYLLTLYLLVMMKASTSTRWRQCMAPIYNFLDRTTMCCHFNPFKAPKVDELAATSSILMAKLKRRTSSATSQTKISTAEGDSVA